VTGGGVPADRSRGWYVAPTVFADVNNSARIAREEIFGPVLSVIPYE
jgi:acyl-CoA reductase-like NAD-dependent aldehyde dehydrogenase